MTIRTTRRNIGAKTYLSTSLKYTDDLDNVQVFRRIK